VGLVVRLGCRTKSIVAMFVDIFYLFCKIRLYFNTQRISQRCAVTIVRNALKSLVFGLLTSPVFVVLVEKQEQGFTWNKS